MRIEPQPLAISERTTTMRTWLARPQARLGLITSLDGSQLLTLGLDPRATATEDRAVLWSSDLEHHVYNSVTPVIPQAHWFERTTWDLFGLYPEGHPRLKHVLLHEPYDPAEQPLRARPLPEQPAQHRQYKFMEVKGEGVYEIPVGPIHAGIIEPGHFRFSCLGEVIINLEIRLGYLHRGVEKRLTEVPWQKARFVAEACASDMPAAEALAHAIALEDMLALPAPPRAQYLRTLALEIERVAMHISDLGGIAGDIGFLGIATSLSRLRGLALRLGELLAGSRLLRAFICPGGVSRDPSETNIKELTEVAAQLDGKLRPVLEMFCDNQVAHDRMEGIGRVSPGLAKDFGLVGVAARASGINYDCRQHFAHGVYPDYKIAIALDEQGDVLARVRVRIAELFTSLALIRTLCAELALGPVRRDLGEHLPANAVGLGIVESHRGELIHLVVTDSSGAIKRYAVKDPSVNNWTALAIAVRNYLVADFPLCNKSFALSYGGHDV